MVNKLLHHHVDISNENSDDIRPDAISWKMKISESGTLLIMADGHLFETITNLGELYCDKETFEKMGIKILNR